MLEDTRPENEGIAWLAHGQGVRALKARAWHFEAQGLSFFAPDFALDAVSPWLVGEEVSGPAGEARTLPLVSHRAEPSSADFERLVDEILSRVDEGLLDKVVPVVCEELEFTESLHASMFPQAFGPRDHLIGYGFELQGEGMAGLTPETLFSMRDDQVSTMALAGTGPVEGPCLLDDDKERREHQMVIDHIHGVLRQFADVDVGATTERPFGMLKHLFTPITARLKREVGFTELVVALHPTAALGGWPRRDAVTWLAAQNFHRARRRFGAPFGWYDSKTRRAECVVAIRNVQWQRAQAQVFTGCGVVRGSQALKEWQELALKRRATYSALGVPL